MTDEPRRETVQQPFVLPQVALDVVQGLDGKLWPRTQFITGATSYVMAMPVEAWRAMRELLNEGLDRAFEACGEPVEKSVTIHRATADDLSRIVTPNRAQRRQNARYS